MKILGLVVGVFLVLLSVSAYERSNAIPFLSNNQQLETDLVIAGYGEKPFGDAFDSFVQLKFAQSPEGGYVSDDRDEIASLLQSQSSVNVIVWLREVGSRGDRQLQEDVLAQLTPEDFELRHRYLIVDGFSGQLYLSGFEKLNQDGRVAQIFLDRVVTPMLAESRPLTGATIVERNLGVTGANVGVCVVDSGVDYTHPSLSSRYLGGYDFVNRDPDPMDDVGHGTHVAGIIASTHDIYRGVAPGSRLVATKVLSDTGGGMFSDIAAAVDWCVNNRQTYGIKIITMSIGDRGQYTSMTCPQYIDPALQAATRNGLFIDASSGNSASSVGVSYPACALGVVSVGATYDADVGRREWPSCIDQITRTDQIACLTNRGAILDVLAPGSVIVSTSSRQGGICTTSSAFGPCSGTSQAAPHVAGIAALLYESNPYLTSSQIEHVLKTTGISVADPVTSLTFPRVDAFAATTMVRQNQAAIATNGTPRIGMGTTFFLEDRLSPAMPYLLLFSLGSTPGIALNDGRTLPLDYDTLFLVSLFYPQWINLQQSQGLLDGSGRAQATLILPNDPQLIGTQFYAAFITLDPLWPRRIASISQSIQLNVSR